MTADEIDALRLILAPAVEDVAGQMCLDHDWPAELTAAAECQVCGMAYGGWTA